MTFFDSTLDVYNFSILRCTIEIYVTNGFKFLEANITRNVYTFRIIRKN